jgi:hypothetical protein
MHYYPLNVLNGGANENRAWGHVFLSAGGMWNEQYAFDGE